MEVAMLVLRGVAATAKDAKTPTGIDRCYEHKPGGERHAASHARDRHPAFLLRMPL
jgi:hypothetical protein